MTIFLIFTLPLVTTLVPRDPITNAEDESSLEGIDPQSPRDSYVYYENTTGLASGVYVSGNYAYVADSNNGLAVLNISNPSNPESPVYEDTIGIANDVYVDGDYAYVADGASGLSVLNISNPTDPGEPINEPTTGVAYGVYVDGDYAYVADGASGLAVFNISDPTDPGEPIYEPTTGVAYSVYVDGDYAYVADGVSGLAVINITDPTNPGTPVYKDTTGDALGVYVSGDYAYVADGDNGLAVIDISDPTSPETPFYEDTNGNAYGICVSGDYAYVADWESGLAVIDISDPTNPGTPVYEETLGTARGVYVSGNYAYVADGDSGLAVIDVSNPINPGAPVYEETLGSARGVYVSGYYAYVAVGDSGLAVINISDPTNPGTAVYEQTVGNSTDVYVEGDYAYLAEGGSGLSIIDISDPTNPGTPVNEYTTGYANSVYVSGNYAYLANGGSGLAIYHIQRSPSPVNLLEIILYGFGVLLVSLITISVVRKRKKRKKKKQIGIAQKPAGIKKEIEAKKSRLSVEKIPKASSQVENELNIVNVKIHEGLYTQAIASLKILEKTISKDKFLSDFEPEISKKLKFCENTTHFRTIKEKIWEIYKSGENFIGAYNGMSKLKTDLNNFPSDFEIIHPAVVLEVNEAYHILKGEYEERKANFLSGFSSISDISKPEEILDLESKFVSFKNEVIALKMDYIIPKINEQHKRYEKNLEIYKEKESLQIFFNQGDISKANFGINKLYDTIEEVKSESGEYYIYSAIALDISELSKQIQAEINERNVSLYDLNRHYETMFTTDQIRNAKELFGNILNDAEALGIKDLTKKIKNNLNICGISISFIEERAKYLQLYSEGQLENAYVGLENLKNRIEVHPRQDLIAPNIKIDIENTYNDIYYEVKNTNANIFGEIESIESLMKSEQIYEAKMRLIQLQNESSQLGFKEVNNKINRMIQVCNISIPILDEKNKYWSQYSDQNQLLLAFDGLQNLVDNLDKGMQSDLIIPSIVSDLRENITFLKSKLDEHRKEIEDKLKQISLTIDPEHLSNVIEVMKTQREIAQKLRFDDIDKKIYENLIDLEDVSRIYGLFKRAKRLAMTDISRKSGISREKLIDMMLDPEKGLEMLELDGDFITVKQLQKQPKQGIAAVPTTEIQGTPYKAGSEKISQNQELQILREFEYISGQVRFRVGVLNLSPGVLTNIKIDFTIPDALKWITYEPITYKRKGDSVIIPKLSLNEKKSINIYLEPISCMSGPINAIVSYFNSLDEPRAITMRPKVIGITCPIFFTEEEANLARVESLYRQLSHKDKKILPIHKGQDLQKIFNLLLKVGGSHQIKLVSKEFSAKHDYGKILYYGLTKVKKQKMVIIFLLSGGEQTIEVEIAGDHEETITALLAEIENQLRVIFTKEKVIRSGDQFHEMKISVILGYCPFCGANFDIAQQEEFIKGNSITCEYCDKVININ